MPVLSGRHRAAGLVETRATPADIPVEWPTKSELAIDLKTGKILGPKIPDKFLARAGEAIE